MKSMDADNRITGAQIEGGEGMKTGERIYKTMNLTGAITLTAGIVITVIGVVTGVMTIVSGAMLLSRKKDVLF